MATLESILKIKDSFTSTINKVSTSMKDLASGGSDVSRSLSSGMGATENAFASAGAGLDNLTSKFRQLKADFSERLVSEDLINMKGSQQEMFENLSALGTKYSAQIKLIDMWKDKIVQLKNEQQRLAQFGDTAGANSKAHEINKAVIQMANLRIAANNTGTAIDKLKAKSTQVGNEIIKCEEEQKLFNRSIQMASSLISGVRSTFGRIGSTIDDVKSRIHNMIDTSKAKMNGFNMNSLLKGFLGVAAIRKGFNATFGAGSALTNQLSGMVGMFGNEDIGRSYFARLKQYASESGQSIDALTNSTQLFLSTTRNTDQLMELNKIAEKLTLKNQSQGLDGAGYAIQEALSGQFSSLKRQFNLSSSQLEPMKKAVAEGNFEGIVSAFDETLASAGITDELVGSMRNTIPNQFKSILNSFKSGFAEAGMGALENLYPLLSQVKEWFATSGADQFFAIVGNGLSFLTEGVNWLGQKVIENWDVIQPILIALGVTTAAVGAIMLASWVMSMAPIFAVIALIAVFIKQLNKAGVTTEDIVSFIGGLFGVLGSTIGNVFIGIWNIAVDVAEFLTNVFIDPVYAIKKLFYDLSIDVLGFFDSMVQGIVSGVNWVIEKINQITGSNLKTVEVNFISGWIDNLEASRYLLTSDRNVVDFSDLKKEYFDGSNAFDQGTEYGLKFLNAVNDGFETLTASEAAWNAANGASLEGIKSDTGKISNSVDIGNEELKYLRDIAEREAINQFTTKTLVPQLTVTFGDVKETADVDKILDKLVEIVDEALNTEAEGDHI